jgi:hypothetical protein
MHARLEILPRHTPVVCLEWQPTPIDDGRKLRGSVRNLFKTLRFCIPEVPSCARP